MTEQTVFVCTVVPTDHTQLFVNREGLTYRSTCSVWSTAAEAHEWGEDVTRQAGIDEESGLPNAVYVVQETTIDGFRREGSHGLN
ncbi:MAG: hypothetical protein MJH10_14105 [Epibacterium sp.]|nr:hypothetical protein [Epibacterium sp.]NQX74664.1 hypothetical protein [Epibacterium sp.]